MNAGVGTAAKATQHPSFQLTGRARCGHGTSSATRRSEPGGGERPPPPVRRSGWVEAEGSLNRETPGTVEAALTTTGRIGTVRRSGSGKQDGRCT